MTVKNNHVVSFDYTLSDAEKTVLDASEGEPLSYLHGHGNIVPGLEEALAGKNVGDHFIVTVPAKDGYGERNEELVMEVPRERFPDDAELSVGMEFEASTDDGTTIVTVTAVDNNTVTIDANHPLAGTDLTFEVTVRDIREATDEEVAHGHPHHEGGCGGCSCGDDCGNACGEDCDCEDEGCNCGGCHAH